MQSSGHQLEQRLQPRDRQRFSVINRHSSGPKTPLQQAVVVAEPILMEGEQDSTFLSVKFGLQLRVKTNPISSIRPRRRSWLAIRQCSQHWGHSVWRDIAVCWSGGEDLIIIISLWTQPCVADLRWRRDRIRKSDTERREGQKEGEMERVWLKCQCLSPF